MSCFQQSPRFVSLIDAVVQFCHFCQHTRIVMWHLAQARYRFINLILSNSFCWFQPPVNIGSCLPCNRSINKRQPGELLPINCLEILFARSEGSAPLFKYFITGCREDEHCRELILNDPDFLHLIDESSLVRKFGLPLLRNKRNGYLGVFDIVNKTRQLLIAFLPISLPPDFHQSVWNFW